ncbi:hypothetical protein MB901379_01905 [Mycobacterium basiliense]|uniref:Uncharacterized protein n=1 Tax=Mycobacterium basiliense TaxID=2094119 RepID=A0A3S4CAW1_9MYCO|nr:hypothetical protein MB901379_01905 [Mycobacterium basiliense]
MEHHSEFVVQLTALVTHVALSDAVVEKGRRDGAT